MNDDQAIKETPKEEFRNIIDEARLILPGIQALFGFQTIAVFSQRYVALPVLGQWVHLSALCMIVIAIALIMTPAAYHRIVDPAFDTPDKIRLASRLVCIALVPLSLGIALDMLVVVLLATGMLVISVVVSAISFVILAGSWFLFPFITRHRKGRGA